MPKRELVMETARMGRCSVCGQMFAASAESATRDPKAATIRMNKAFENHDCKADPSEHAVQ